MPIFYRFRDITIFWSKLYGSSPFLPTPVSFKATLGVFLWNLWYGGWSQRTRDPGYGRVKTACFCRPTIIACDRQTDRQTDRRTNRWTRRLRTVA